MSARKAPTAACGLDFGTSNSALSLPHGNAVRLVALEDDAPLESLVGSVKAANREIKRPADHIRLFQLPLERIV